MTSKERILKALQHQETDKVPFSLGFGVNEYARKQLAARLGCTVEEIGKRISSKSDIRGVSPAYIGPPHLNLNKPGSPNIWGVIRKPVFNGFDTYQEIDVYPLAGLGDTMSLNDHQWPSPDWFDYSVIKNKVKEINRDDEYAIMMGNGNIFETSWYMTGLENSLMLACTDPDLIYSLFEKVTDYYVKFFERALEAADGSINLVFTADDIGQQHGLIMSLPMWEELLKPHHARLNKTLHAAGVKIVYHTDGAVMEAMDGLVDMGIDVLEAIQFDAKGMDPVKLKNNWGDKLCFHGGISVQSTLPFGTVDAVRREVRDRISVLGKNGGYIVAPSHAIQGGTPPQNILAFFEEVGRPLA